MDKIPENCITCPFIHVGTCGCRIETSEKREPESFGRPFDEPNTYNPNLIPKTYDCQEGN